MRFAELQLLKYGRFEDCVLSFRPSDCDLQIIFGPNEAGKSTTLAAVGDLLFGFPHVTPYAFRFDRQLLRVGAVIEDGGPGFAVRRRKGTGHTLLGGDDQQMDPTALAGALGGQTRESFERMFGLDHERLREGGRAILDARDDVGQAIFAAGSGLVRITQVCADLEAEAKAIWTSRAGESRTYTAAARAYQEAKATLKAVQVRPAQWTQARRTLDEAQTQLSGLRAVRAAIERECRTLERRRRILQPVASRQAVIDQVETLGETLELAPDAGDRFEAALQLANGARARIDLTSTRIAELGARLAAAQPAAGVLEACSDVEALREMKGGVDQRLSDLPRLGAECATRRSAMERLQREIGWPAESAAVTRARLPGRPALAELRDLLERRSGIDQQQQYARDTLEEAAVGIEALHAQLDGLPPIVEIQPLQACLRRIREGGDLEDRVLAAARVRRELQELVATRMMALRPWTGDRAGLVAIPMPADEDIDAAIDALDAAQEKLAAERAAAAAEAERLEQLWLERDQARQGRITPSAEELVAARRERQAAWTPLKAHVLGKAVAADPTTALEVFEREISAADRVADERFDGAEHAGGLAAVEREIQKCELRGRQAQERLDRCEVALGAARSMFETLVSPLGFAITPQAFDAWREGRTASLEAASALDAAAADLAVAEAAETAARDLLAAQLGETAGIPPISLRGLLAAAETRLEAASAAHASRGALAARIEAAAAAELKAKGLSRTAMEALKAWDVSWAPALQRLGLDGDISIAGVRSRLELIEALRIEVDEILELQPRLEQANAFIAGFDDRVAAVAERVGLPLE